MIRKATPIWLAETKINQYIEAKETFCLKDISENAILQVCADAEYVVYLNGSFVGSGQYRTLPNRKVYDEYEVGGLLQQGENELRMIAYSQGKDSSTYHTDLPMLAYALAAGEVCLLSGEKTLVREHPYYQSGEIEHNSPQLGFTYYYHADAAETSWDKPVKVAREYQFEKRPVSRLEHGQLVSGRILAQGYLQRVTEGTAAKQMQEDGLFWKHRREFWDGNRIRCQENGVFFVIDLEEEMAGLFHMKITAAAGTVLDIGWGEHLEDLRVRSCVGSRNFACRYVCKAGEQEFTGYFRRMAGRYLQIHITNMGGDLTVQEMGLIPTEYPLAREGYFQCNDYLFNHLMKISANTLKLCMHEHYEDCPWREQSLYAYDSFIQMLCGYYLFGEYEFPRASLRLLADTQMEDGFLTLCAPAHDKLTIPSFSLSWILSVEKYILYSGDVAFGKEILEVAERILTKAFRIRESLVYTPIGEKYWQFYEWTDGLSGEIKGKGNAAAEAPLSCLYILAYEAYQRILDYIGADDTARAAVVCDTCAIRRAVKETFRNPDTGLIRTREGDERYHEYTQALAILSGVADEEAVYEALLDRESGLVPLTLSTSIFKYEALLSRDEKYLDVVLEDIARIWGAMLFAGATTLWEVAEGAPAFDDAGSLCHAWSAVPVYLFYKYYLGYEPTAPGFASYRLEPKKTHHISEMETILYQPGKAIEYAVGKEG